MFFIVLHFSERRATITVMSVCVWIIFIYDKDFDLNHVGTNLLIILFFN